MNGIDRSFFFTLYNLSYHSRLFDLFITFFGEYFFYFILLISVCFAYKNYKRKTQQLKLYGFALLSAIIARFGIASIIRFFYHRPRPFLVLSLSHLISDNTYSFPSGHTIFMFSLATAVYYFNKKLAYFLYGSGLLIGFARVAGGVHYPSDVVGGIILGMATSVAIHALIKTYSPQKNIL